MHVNCLYDRFIMMVFDEHLQNSNKLLEFKIWLEKFLLIKNNAIENKAFILFV